MQGAAPKRARPGAPPGSISPAAVPLNGVTSCAATLSRARTPGRSGAPGASDRLGDRGHLDAVVGDRLGGLGVLGGRTAPPGRGPPPRRPRRAPPPRRPGPGRRGSRRPARPAGTAGRAGPRRPAARGSRSAPPARRRSVTERPPGGEHPLMVVMPEVHEIGQSGRPVIGDRRRHLDHLQERHRAFPCRGSPPEQGPQPAAGAPRWPARPARWTSRSPAATPIEPARNLNSETMNATQGPRRPLVLRGRPGPVPSAPLAWPSRLRAAGADAVGRGQRPVPAPPGSGVDDRIDQLDGAETVWPLVPPVPASATAPPPVQLFVQHP